MRKMFCKVGLPSPRSICDKRLIESLVRCERSCRVRFWVFLASRTGLGIVPAAFSCRRGLRIQGTWTDMLLPLPFTTTYCLLGEPIYVPSEMTREETDFHRQRVQDAMDRLYARVDAWAAGRIERSDTEEAMVSRKVA